MVFLFVAGAEPLAREGCQNQQSDCATRRGNPGPGSEDTQRQRQNPNDAEPFAGGCRRAGEHPAPAAGRAREGAVALAQRVPPAARYDRGDGERIAADRAGHDGYRGAETGG